VGVGRRAGEGNTRSAIVDAARALFATGGLSGTSVRAIAARAGVSPGMVHHYFVSKVDLFVESLAMPLNPANELPRLRDEGPHAELGERIVRFFVRTWRNPDTGEPLRGLLRSAVQDPQTAEMLKTFVEQVLLPSASVLFDVPRERIAAGLSQLLGWALLATVLQAQPLASLDEDQLVRLFGPSLQRQLDG
jgi:AcrR family transcriptional regulator